MNVMCGAGGGLLAILDWGDAGWGDPALELAQVPLGAAPALVEGYREIAAPLLGDLPEARIAWDQLTSLLEDWSGESSARQLAEWRRFARSARDAWRG